MSSPGQALSPQRKLELVAARLNELHEGWTVDGDQVRGPGTTAVRLGPPHLDSPGHIDLDFVLDVGDPAKTTVTDCCSGFSEDVEEAISDAIRMWADTAASAVLEMLTQEGRFGPHFDDGHPAAFPGWHLVMGGITGWSLGQASTVLQRWIADTRPWVALAPVLAPALYPKRVNGVKIFIAGGADDFVSAEVRVNGRVHRPSSRALYELGFPPSEEGAVARTYLLLMRR